MFKLFQKAPRFVEGATYQLNGVAYTATFAYTAQDQAGYGCHQLGGNKPMWCMDADSSNVEVHTDVNGIYGRTELPLHNLQVCDDGSVWVACRTANGDTHSKTTYTERDFQ